MRIVVVMAVLFACRSDQPAPEPKPEPPPAVAPKPTTVEGRLEAAMRSNMLQEQAPAVVAIAEVRLKKLAPLLYLGLDASPNVRVLSAHALVDMRITDGLPKLREALAKSKDRDLELEMGMALIRLGDKDPKVRAIVNSGTLKNHAMWRLEASLALADVGDDLGRAPLADIAKNTPADGDVYWRALGGLAKLGDQPSLAILEAELGKKPASRVLRAAKQLAYAGSAKGKDRLAAFIANKDFENPEDAAMALAVEGDRRALTWVAEGLNSPDPKERKQAVQIAAWFVAAEHRAAIARLATSDPDETVKATAEVALVAF